MIMPNYGVHYAGRGDASSGASGAGVMLGEERDVVGVEAELVVGCSNNAVVRGP